LADDWFKLNMDIFGNRKIKYLRRLPGGNSIALFWIALLAEARRCNSDGKIFLTESMPYTPQMLADEFDFEENTVKFALEAFKQLDMIETNNGFIEITGWEDHQNTEGLAKIREQTRKRVAKCRENKKLLCGSVTSSVTVTQSNALEEDKEEEKELEIDIEKEEKISCQQIVDLFHSICTSYPKIRSLSSARKKAINARLKSYSLEDFKTVFENAENSTFLKGSNDRNWSANFDWLIADKNMAKVLEGNYADKPKRYGRKEPVPGWMGFQPGEAELEAIRQQMQDDPVTVGNDPDLAERAEQLRQRLGG
jgi:predicted phage replisome organizer